MNRVRAHADLLTVLHDIDAMRGRICKNCRHRVVGGFFVEHTRCGLGMKPEGADDGCDRFQRRPQLAFGVIDGAQ